MSPQLQSLIFFYDCENCQRFETETGERIIPLLTALFSMELAKRQVTEVGWFGFYQIKVTVLFRVIPHSMIYRTFL